MKRVWKVLVAVVIAVSLMCLTACSIFVCDNCDQLKVGDKISFFGADLCEDCARGGW